ncbi:apolipoprotein N-acyltransferase [Rheinheimera sp.]|uniref:apolipoprotein N-acyltransferase n=1 Tax=Rheinheimera sp. TaxID=1869214 RepID=UPI003D2E90FF
MRLNISAKTGLWSLLLCAAGLLNTFAFAPYHWHALPLFTLTLLALALRQTESPRQAAWFGWCYGIGWFGLGVSWVHVSIATFGGMPLLASLSIMAALVAYLSLFPALAAYSAARLAKSRPHHWPLLLAVCWTLSENLRSWLFTGFPWLSLGYSQTDGWLASYAPLVGETGINFILLLAAGSFALLWRYQPSRVAHGQLAAAVVLLALPPVLGHFKGWQTNGVQVPVALVQGNIRQELRWAPEQELPTMKKYMQLTRPQLAERLVIWPEAAIPQVEPDAQAYLFNLDMLAAENKAAVITGILDWKRNGDAYNGMIVVGDTGVKGQIYHYETRNRYQKHHLLPIGEFVPFERFLRDVAPFFDLPNSSFARGEWLQPNLQAKGYQLLAALCFEIAFPRQIRANFTDDTDFLLTVSNDAWFGDSHGPWQHLEIARMRALEFGRPLLRATNTGVTAAIGADGQVLAQLPQFQDGVLTLDVPLTQGRTLYSRLGDWPLYLFCLLTGVMLWWRQHQRKAPATAAMSTPANANETASQTPAVASSEHAATTETAESPAKERIEPHF